MKVSIWLPKWSNSTTYIRWRFRQNVATHAIIVLFREKKSYNFVLFCHWYETEPRTLSCDHWFVSNWMSINLRCSFDVLHMLLIYSWCTHSIAFSLSLELFSQIEHQMADETLNEKKNQWTMWVVPTFQCFKSMSFIDLETYAYTGFIIGLNIRHASGICV